MFKLAGYQIGSQIYDGTRTQVYHAIKEENSQQVILKKLRKEYPTFSEMLQFRHQYILSKNLDAAGIVKPITLEKYGNGYVLVMEDVGGISLSDYYSGSLSLDEFFTVGLALTKILEHLYRNRVIHKDIKPANILINPETKEIFLIDFSISSLLAKESQEIQNPNVLEGTLAYISPEQTGRMNRGIDYRSDFYSLGVTFYELLTGELPFKSEEPMELVHCHIARMPPELGKRQEAILGNRQEAIGNRTEEIPGVLSDIVLKLMAKTAENRYQSALGLKCDLEKCQFMWRETGNIEPFELGERDISDRFNIPEKLYGREAEVLSLLSAFDRVASGKTEMMLVAGFSGIGKTAVVNEVHKPIVRQRGYFVKGKFDQFQRNVPFSALVIALRDLMGQLLGESEVQLESWKNKILDALGENALVIMEMIPELEFLIGKQPPVPELSGSAAQNRFNLLFQKFIRVFATREHPLVIFLDDLQWADSSSLKSIQLLMGEGGSGYLLLLGAYRDNEVFPAHPLMLTLSDIAKSGATLNTITLAPLNETDLNRLVADTLSCEAPLALPLTALLRQKTKGNPFFATQFLKSLHEDGWIAFNFDVGYWQCDMARVRELALTDDVVEFMAARLHKLPEATRELLKLAACIGNQFDLETLAVVSEGSQTEVASCLWAALQEGLILPLNETYKFYQQEDTNSQFPIPNSPFPNYKFLHDRVQQAAYSLIPEDQKQTAHYRIGQLLLETISPEARGDRIFELVGQLNYGTALITEQTERDELAKLNLRACRQARAATAEKAGREYASIGLSLLGEKAWQRQYELTLAFHNLAAELASLDGDFEGMEGFARTVVEETESLLDRVNVCRIKILFRVSQNQLSEAIAIALQFLGELGVTLNDTPTGEDIQQSIAEIEKAIGDRPIEELAYLPPMTDSNTIAIVEIANSITPAAYISGSALFPLLVALCVKLSIQYGNIPSSASAYAIYGIIACNMLHDVDAGVNFGRLALRLLSQLDAKTVKHEVLHVVGLFILHRKSHVKEALPLSREGYITALEVGNWEYVGYTAHSYSVNAFWSGEPLAAFEVEARAYCQTLVQLNQLTTANWCSIYWQSTLNLLGVAGDKSVLSGEAIQEAVFLPQLLEANDLTGLFFFYLYKLMLCYLFEEIESARNYAAEVKRYLMGGAGVMGEPVFYFYDSLSALAAMASRDASFEIFQLVEENQRQLQQQWACYAPMNHQHKVDLVEAEKCRVLGQHIEAIELYEKAIALAAENEYIHEEALANELAAKFYLEWGKEKIARTYMSDAYYCYARWGARAKVDDLEKRYPQLLAPILNRESDRTQVSNTIAKMTVGTFTTTNTEISLLLDISSAIKANRVLSGEMELKQLLVKLMQMVMENAGATKSALLIPQNKKLCIEGIAAYSASDGLEVSSVGESLPIESTLELPIEIIQTVWRAGEAVAINDVLSSTESVASDYLKLNQPQSLWCTPLVNGGRLVAILYLENKLTPGAFTSDRLSILNILTSQAAISIENARLYERSTNYARQLEDYLTQLQEAQLQLVQSEKMATIGQLVSGIAHEINNPVGFISGNLDYASEYIQDLINLVNLYVETFPKPGARIEEEIEDIELDYLIQDLPQTIDSMKEGTNRIAEISKSMRTFSRSDTEAKVNFNLHDGIDSTLLILKHRLKSNEKRPEIKVVKNYGNLPEVNCYPGQLNQVFMNLIANAIDALEEGNSGRSLEEIKAQPNRIAITTQIDEAKENAIVRIADNGRGMSEEVKQKIFDHLFTTKEVGTGTGLGLSISRQIVVEKHGGTITCTSEVGKGTEFAIALPF